MQLKLLSSDQDHTQLQSCRIQDTLLVMLILLSAVAAITWGTAELGTKVSMLPFDIQGHWLCQANFPEHRSHLSS